MPYSPLLIDPASTDNIGSYSMAPNGYGWAQQNSPFVYNGKLYMVLYRATNAPAANDFSINVFVSSDKGSTWAALDAAHAPVRGTAGATGGCYFDGGHTVTVAWTDGSQLGATGTIHLQDFDLSAGVWGAAYGAAGSPVVNLVDQIYKRPDGSLIALFNRTFAAGRVQGLSAAVFSAGAWGAAFPIDSNITAGNVSDSRAATVMDASGNLYVFTRCTDTATFSTHFWSFQIVNADNSLGASHNFATTDLDATVNGNGNPVLIGNQVVFGAMTPLTGGQAAVVVVGTPLSAPVFTISPGIDPGSPFSAGGTYYVPVLAASATTLYGLIAITDTSGLNTVLSLRLGQTTNLANPAAGWSWSEIYNIASGPPSFNFVGQVWNNRTLAIYNNNTQIFVTAGAQIDAAAVQDTWFWFGIFTGVAANFSVTLHGVNRYPRDNSSGPQVLVVGPEPFRPLPLRFKR